MSEHVYLISKAERESAYAHAAFMKADGDGYRGSYLRGINPRSHTEVREGSMPKRAVRYIGGSALGGGVGYIAGSAAGPTGSLVGGAIGGAIGSTLGRTRNLRSGDTRATNRRSGRKATGSISVPTVGNFWTYGNKG